MGDREEREAKQPDDMLGEGLHFGDEEVLDPNANPCVGGGTNGAKW